VVKLVYEELCRRRHPISLRELLAGGWEEGSALLFKLVSKKLELSPLPGASLPPCVLASQRAERFKAAKTRASLRDPLRLMVQSPVEQTPTGRPPRHAQEQPDSQVAVLGPRDYVALSNPTLVSAVAHCLRTNVERAHWVRVIDLAREATLHPPQRLSLPKAGSLEELIAKTVPSTENFQLSHLQDLIRFKASWILTWLYICRPYIDTVRPVLEAGYRLAVSQERLATSAA
jgi:hypothetical protein